VSHIRSLTAKPWMLVFAVRRDWPVDGTHEFVGFSATAAEAGWFALADRSYWRRGPVRPGHSVVEISARDFDLHTRRRECRAPDCPVAAPVPARVDTVEGGA